MKLTNEIVYRVFNSLGITSKQNVSILNYNFKLNEVITFTVDDDYINITLYGCQVKIHDSTMKLLVADLGNEFALVTKFENCPSYGCYLAIENGEPQDGLICFSIKNQVWLGASISLQATFLAGMENLREVMAPWTPLKSHDELIEDLKSFIDHHDNIGEDE